MMLDMSGTVRYINPALEKVLGADLKTLTAQNFFGGQNQDYASLLLEIRQTIQSNEVWKGQVPYQKDNQRQYTFETSVSPMRSQSDDLIGYLCIGRDITTEQKLENQLRHAQKMEAIGTLAGGIAHDFNNILATIIGYTELSLYQPIADTVKNNLEQIYNTSLRARDLVKQILAFSCRGPLERKPAQLQPLVREAASMLRASIPATIEIVLDIDEKAGMVMADPTQIHQVLMNLCTNAAQAMSVQGDLLEISLSRVTITNETIRQYRKLAPGDYVRLGVSDNGPGIPTEIKDRIFDPFLTTKETGQGTGMGLAAVHGIVESHAGEITVSSIPGAGACFHVLLPTVTEQRSSADVPAKKPPRGHETILFVDDEKNLVEIGRRRLASLGYKVIVRQNSLEALEAFSRAPEDFDVIITDQTMPTLTGLELAHKILEIRPGTPIILCTGYSERVTPETLQAVGIAKLIFKPFETQELAETLRAVLDNSRS